MAAKRGRRTPQRRKRAPQPRHSGLKLLFALGLLVIVFCAAAGATLWLTAAPQPTTSAETTGEGFTAEERKALEEALRNSGDAKRP